MSFSWKAIFTFTEYCTNKKCLKKKRTVTNAIYLKIKPWRHGFIAFSISNLQNNTTLCRKLKFSLMNYMPSVVINYIKDLEFGSFVSLPSLHWLATFFTCNLHLELYLDVLISTKLFHLNILQCVLFRVKVLGHYHRQNRIEKWFM